MPSAIRPYIRLARFDRPIGTWLVLFPGWWSLLFAGFDPLDESGRHIYIFWLFLLFGLGAIVMRGAGCILNDVFDKDYDSKVARTSDRPLPSGEISIIKALVFMAFLSLLGFIILIQFNLFAIVIGGSSLLVVLVYPLMKRITWWPQLFLGITFNWGAIMGWTAATGEISYHCIILYIGCIFWTIGYDTIYAHQDKIDDNFLGLKSTAILFGSKTKVALYFFYLIFIATIAITINIIVIKNLYINSLFLFFIFMHLFSQIFFLNINNPDNCLKIFKSNNSLGIIIFMLLLSNYF